MKEAATLSTDAGDFVQVGWWYEDATDGGRLCWSSHITRAPWWKNARNVRPAYDLRPTRICVADHQAGEPCVYEPFDGAGGDRG